MLLVGPGPKDWSDSECFASRAELYPPLNMTGEVECSCQREGMVQVIWDRPPAYVNVDQVFDYTTATIPFIQRAPLFAVPFYIHAYDCVPSIRNPKPETRNPKPNKPETINHKP